MLKFVKMLPLLLVIVVAAGCFGSGGNNDSGNAANQNQNQNGQNEIENTPDAPVDPWVENDAFRLFSPEPESTVGNTFTVTGQAKVFEAAFSYELEDGHNILDKGTAMADQGAPEWDDFEIPIQFGKATSPHLTLTLYVASAKDGSRTHELIVPLDIDEAHLEMPQ